MSINLCGASSSGNTGIIECDVAPGIPTRFAIWRGRRLATEMTGALFQTVLENGSRLSKTATDKVFPFPKIQDVADITEADTTGSLNQGFTVVLREGKPAYTFKCFAGSALVQQLRTFNGQSVPIVMFDSNNKGWLEKSGNYVQGAICALKVSGLRFGTGGEVQEGVVTITLSYQDAKSLNENGAFGRLSNDAGIIGLLDVNLVTLAAHASNVYYIGGGIPTQEIGVTANLHDEYDTELAVVTAWRAYTGSGYGTPLTITSVTNDAVRGGWIFTYDTTAFAALPANASIKLQGAPPEVLDGLGVAGIEILPIYVTK